MCATIYPFAGVMELADVTDSKSVDGDIVWVRVPPPAPKKKSRIHSCSSFLMLWPGREATASCTQATRRHYSTCALLTFLLLCGIIRKNQCTKSRAKRVHIKVREFLNIILLIINIISFVLVLLFGASGIIYELFGPANYEKILQKLKIPWSFERIWLFMFVCLIILIITYILRKKFF